MMGVNDQEVLRSGNAQVSYCRGVWFVPQLGHTILNKVHSAFLHSSG
jgi:hypothetical protein